MKTRGTKNRWWVFALAGVSLLGVGCDNRESASRLRLPPGDAERGRAAFIALQCTKCHTVAGVELPKPTVEPKLVVALGGSVARVRTVGDLLNAIMHPPERPAVGTGAAGTRPPAANMPVVNEVMTVAQLIDLVRFLQPRYTQMEPPLDWYLTP
jgi:hypothetical protein